MIISRFALLAIAAAANLTAAERVVTVHLAAPVANAPVIDGKLDEACWKTLPKTTTMYYFWSPAPSPAGSRTEFQLGYDKAGIYLGVRLWEDSMSTIKASITGRGDGNLWQDDCCETYFDPTAAAVGYRKFIFNSLSAQSGVLQMDGANVDNSWNPDGWKVATTKDDKGWTAELFYPYKDLDKIAVPGALWRFAMTRFGYSKTGSFATSAPGAKYDSPGAFGWLYFLATAEAEPLKLGRELSATISGDWLLPVGSSAIACRAGQVTVVPLADPVIAGRTQVQAGLKSVRSLPGAGDDAVVTELKAISDTLATIPTAVSDAAVFSKAVLDANNLFQRLENVAYSLKLDELLRSVAPPAQ